MISTSEKNRDIVVLGSMVPAVGLLIVFAFWLQGWKYAFVWSLFFFLFYTIYAVFSGDGIMRRFVVFATIAGLVELIADWWLVVKTGTLIYPAGEPMIWKSPAYMPLAWAVVLIQLGYIGFLVHKRSNVRWATAAVGFLGCLMIPFYEYLAIHAGWWSYVNTPTWGIVPKYIYIAEGLLMLTIPDLFDRTENSGPLKLVTLGTLQGLVMWIACMIAFALTE